MASELVPKRIETPGNPVTFSGYERAQWNSIHNHSIDTRMEDKGTDVSSLVVEPYMKRLTLGLFFAVLCVSAGGAKAEARCEDFLATLSDKPDFVELVECVQANDRQGKPFVARYQVKGKDALKAERYMTQSFGLPTLKFICCGWDSTPYFYRDKKTNLGYMLGMGSEETLINRRESWSEIKFFHIEATFFTGDP
ncbi:DUF4952 domain-containing protein [Pigmentiphaga aceris]|nr:DUF4952 domain-containing protein [Pigmentiphaga aceris]